MFKTRKMRTFLTILGVGVGIGTVLFLVSLGYGLQNVVLGKITTADSLLSLDVSPGTAGIIGLSKENVEEIKKIEHVAEVSPVWNISAQISIDQLTGDALVYGVEPSFFRLSGIIPEIGSIFNSASDRKVVISSAAAKLFNIPTNEIVGKQIGLTLFLTKKNADGFEETESTERDGKYTIIGVIEDENTSYVFLPLETIMDLEIDSFTQLKVKVAANEYMEPIRNNIMDRGFIVSSLSDTIDQANKIFRIVQIVLALFGLVALIVSAIGMFNTMTIALLERINEIGIMRSIGASTGDIRKLFILESFLMGFLGGVFGVITGWVGGELANFGINLLAKSFGGQSLDLFYQPTWFVVLIIVFSSFIGFLTGVYPARKAAKLNPLTALRYK
jgi:ABC-type antimicrobial peptide transport system permease subunit